jgi:hypothetical protein
MVYGRRFTSVNILAKYIPCTPRKKIINPEKNQIDAISDV